ncbi:MAG: oxygen-dependent coproporphyrinogen oxidase [Gammaproteobacteria bacterium]|jgi:coproporphyrinogen III oxidase|nr:oxygen-dependent coproporphyrinogen oxidase [Gammaproteobacteria bacterium]MBT4462271.1 oxygen-dependent coproporphyrinogen oxidase [Gammaproteobacteria bacterium]MBT4655198.1 oxygen-dependent coproporphyrinogen oxidase [Gammaproteobacteria bacterium]MBT5116981.1 oxygen-dependent coproporphyrinogen oxidase [Gammaproteobacteria bacterium]MBT5762015.1 oxygen-dependent coproporphyrinogen oxidase [Gammaproteobacteria bacterium]
MKKSNDFVEIESLFKKLQKTIINGFMSLDTKVDIKKTNWKYKSGGGGLSCEFIDGKVIEKGMINFSSIEGLVLPNSALAKKIKGNVKKFHATGVSIVIHPENPFVPCSHFNIRYFETDSKSKKNWWFGGGFDLTPYFVYPKDVSLWHDSARQICDNYSASYYKDFSKQCDEYFFNKHRNEKRGVGGLFFDNLNNREKDFHKNFVLDTGKTYLQTYSQIIKKRKNKKYNKIHKTFQQIRRGRYVEFNLVYDRGTLFGLQSGGRAESILMSMPPSVIWTGKKNIELAKFEKNLKKYL